ncbi:hypothetical protein ACQBAR_00010 [Propionibacteriaceae bacterium Y1685]|uniref:hypothetical protein n=1 Tax=Microlunatus sp. Y1700 TaxID=3418487 RepID=UPI003B7A1944
MSEFTPYDPDPPGRPIICPVCDGDVFEQGFIDDAQGSVRWYAGELETGVLGRPQHTRRTWSYVLARRCVQCSRLDLYAGP